MNDCDREGINGNCGFDCRVFLLGECEIADEMGEEAEGEDLKLHIEIYGEPDVDKRDS